MQTILITNQSEKNYTNTVLEHKPDTNITLTEKMKWTNLSCNFLYTIVTFYQLHPTTCFCFTKSYLRIGNLRLQNIINDVNIFILQHYHSIYSKFSKAKKYLCLTSNILKSLCAQ